MKTTRYLCSELVTLRRTAADITVNLEEIWSGGAVVEAEIEIAAGEKVELLAETPEGEAVFPGSIASVEGHQFGWRAEIEFSAAIRWNIESWRPAHLIDFWVADESSSQ